MSATSDTVLAVTTKFLGPAARRFLERQTKFHMQNVSFDAIGPDGLPMLLKWIHTSGKLVIDDKAEVLVSTLESTLGINRAR
jgi:hypothetical protein